MLASAATALLLGSVCSAAVLPRETAPAEASQKFIVHSKPQAAENFDESLGYLFAEYSYGGGSYATLHTAKSDAITGALSDVNDPKNSGLNFDESTKGFKLYDLSQQYPNSIAQIFSGQEGTHGMVIEDGLLKWHSPDDQAISWFGMLPAVLS